MALGLLTDGSIVPVAPLRHQALVAEALVRHRAATVQALQLLSESDDVQDTA